MKTKSVILLGSTGSIGMQALDVCRQKGIRVEALSCNRSLSAAEKQVREFHPRWIAVADAKAAKQLSVSIADTDTQVLSGMDGICEMIESCKADLVLNAIVGCAGLLPTMTAINSGKRLALANKESMVCGGEIVTDAAKKNQTHILPVDSEHSAIFQCLLCGSRDEVRRLILTASGGPFFGWNREKMRSVRPGDALAHPTWNMGAKITIDSATMMNKGFEVIEAARLFDIRPDKIDVVVHRESIIHSMVEYIDNVVMAQMGAPDMRTCIQLAFSYPQRAEGVSGRLDFTRLGTLSFASPDDQNFPLLPLARSVAENTIACCAMNAANEIAVAAFLEGRLSFCDISDIVIEVTRKFSGRGRPSGIPEILRIDAEARELARESCFKV